MNAIIIILSVLCALLAMSVFVLTVFVAKKFRKIATFQESYEIYKGMENVNEKLVSISDVVDDIRDRLPERIGAVKDIIAEADALIAERKALTAMREAAMDDGK